MCKHVNTLDTKTKFVILMHPKEFKKVKNGTGHLTHLALKNSELFHGIDFTNHKKINHIINTHESFVLYPSKDAINLSKSDPTPNANKKIAIFIIDSTWACSLKMLRESKNLQTLKTLSFTSSKLSQFKIKEQPAEYCLSTIESTLEVIQLLKQWNMEHLEQEDLDKFLNPFEKMVEYQLECIAQNSTHSVRFKERY